MWFQLLKIKKIKYKNLDIQTEFTTESYVLLKAGSLNYKNKLIQRIHLAM